MGGWGSGWQGPRKTTVSECWTVRLRDLRAALATGPGTPGTLTWRSTRTGGPVAQVGFVVTGDEDAQGVRLRYQVRRAGGDPVRVDELVRLTHSTLYRGGRCPYLSCPGCGARVRTLHLPPNGTRFRCRACHDLTYGSCQDAHRWDALLQPIAADVGLTAAQLARLFRERYP